MRKIEQWVVQHSFKADYKQAVRRVDQPKLDGALVAILSSLKKNETPAAIYSYHKIRGAARYEGYFRCDLGDNLYLILRYPTNKSLRLVRLCEREELMLSGGGRSS